MWPTCQALVLVSLCPRHYVKYLLDVSYRVQHILHALALRSSKLRYRFADSLLPFMMEFIHVRPSLTLHPFTIVDLRRGTQRRNSDRHSAAAPQKVRHRSHDEDFFSLPITYSNASIMNPDVSSLHHIAVILSSEPHAESLQLSYATQL